MGRPKLPYNDGPCANGCKRKAYCRGLCSSCYRRDHYERTERVRRGAKKTPPVPLGALRLEKTGYVSIKVEPGRGVGGRDWMLHHRYIMEEHLGRTLRGDETVHHCNGNKADNRVSNLELWCSSQPPGARVTDLLAWAYEILDRYGETNA